jgi:hypothetical protein
VQLDHMEGRSRREAGLRPTRLAACAAVTLDRLDVRRWVAGTVITVTADPLVRSLCTIRSPSWLRSAAEAETRS